MAIMKMRKGHKRIRKSHLRCDLTECDLSLSLPPILPQTSMIRCSFGSVTVSENVSPGRRGRFPAIRQPQRTARIGKPLEASFEVLSPLPSLPRRQRLRICPQAFPPLSRFVL